MKHWMKRLTTSLIVLGIAAASVMIVHQTFAAVGPNLVSNPSVEIVDPVTTTSPQAWLKGSRGTNTHSFSYPTTGRTGTRSVRVDITAYTNGDAKWYFAPVAVTPGKSYTYSEYFKSNVTSEVVIEIESTTGIFSYQRLSRPSASATRWKAYSTAFTMPATAKKATVMHVINKVGWVQIDDIYFGLTTYVAPPPVAPTVSLTAPAAGEVVSATQNVTATAASTDATVAGVQFKLNGANLGTEDLTAPYETSWNTTTTTDGSHDLTAVARSTNGLVATSATVNVTVQNTITPPTGPNLLPNPSMDSVGADQLPISWLSSKWGTNTTSFMYETTGRTDRSLKTTISAFTDGDAKWYAAPLDVKSGQAYSYSHYFRSNVATEIVAAFIDASGTYTYQSLGTIPASATNWQQAAFNFTTPATAQKATVFHILNRVGWLQIDDASLIEITAPPDATSVVPNSSLETASGANPASWTGSAWGTNTPTLQYMNEGRTGTKSVKVTVANYTSGDAKWVFNPITTLEKSKQYRFTAWYKTNTTPKVVAMYERPGGTQYLAMQSPFPPSGSDTTWQQYSDSFTVPFNATSVSIFMLIDKNGWLQTDDYDITSYQPTGFNRGLVSLTFDDAHEDNVNTALPILTQYGFKSTQCYATKFIEGNSQAIANVRTFFNAGHEICSHTVSHPFLTQLTTTQLTYELQYSQQYLESIIGQPVRNFASPYGDYNASVNNIIDNYYQAHRSVDEGYNSKDNFNAYRLRVQNILNTTTVAEIQGWVNHAKATNTWLILVYHRVAANAGPFDTFTNDFAPQMQAIQDSGITVKTYQDALTEVKAQL